MHFKRFVVSFLALDPRERRDRLRSAEAAGIYSVRRPAADTFKGDFKFCRIAFRAGYGGYGGGWGVDYPRADENLSIRLSELSNAAVNFDKHGTPNYVVIQATEPELFKCPFVAADQPWPRDVQPRRGRVATRVSEEGRISLGRRRVGQLCVGPLA